MADKDLDALTERIDLNLSSRMKERLAAWAGRERRSMGFIIRDYIQAGLDADAAEQSPRKGGRK